MLLRRCLKTIPWRQDVQVIVVDDGSEEEAVAELRGMEKEFTGAEFLYSNECLGAGHARNMGLEAAKGDYLIFADADDFFNGCFEDILREYGDRDYDIVFFNANSVDTDTMKPATRSWHVNRMIDRYPEHEEESMIELRYSFGEPWGKIIKRSIVESNNIRFDETKIHNDTTFSYLVGLYCTKAYVDSRFGYCVTDRVGSVSKKSSYDRLLIRTEVFTRANVFYRDHGIPLFEERGMRPMMMFLLKGKLSSFKECYRIMKKCGMTGSEIVFHIMAYPYYIIAKLNMKRYKSKMNK